MESHQVRTEIKDRRKYATQAIDRINAAIQKLIEVEPTYEVQVAMAQLKLELNKLFLELWGNTR